MKPLPRGSGEFSLKDINRLDELGAEIAKKVRDVDDDQKPKTNWVERRLMFMHSFNILQIDYLCQKSPTCVFMEILMLMLMIE